jgi:hypothetical protein
LASWPGEFLRIRHSCRSALAVEEKTELILTHTDLPESHGPAPYQTGWEGGLEKFQALFTGAGVDA